MYYSEYLIDHVNSIELVRIGITDFILFLLAIVLNTNELSRTERHKGLLGHSATGVGDNILISFVRFCAS